MKQTEFNKGLMDFSISGFLGVKHFFDEMLRYLDIHLVVAPEDVADRELRRFREKMGGRISSFSSHLSNEISGIHEIKQKLSIGYSPFISSDFSIVSPNITSSVKENSFPMTLTFTGSTQPSYSFEVKNTAVAEDEKDLFPVLEELVPCIGELRSMLNEEKHLIFKLPLVQKLILKRRFVEVSGMTFQEWNQTFESLGEFLRNTLLELEKGEMVDFKEVRRKLGNVRSVLKNLKVYFNERWEKYEEEKDFSLTKNYYSHKGERVEEIRNLLEIN